MSRQPIPKRKPIGDPFAGFVLQAGSHVLLAASPQSNTEMIAEGRFVVRYGVRFLGKPHLSIVPGLIALDYGAFFVGEEAWDFLLNRSDLYPRSDVLGYRNDGEDEMIVIKLLDLQDDIDVLIYPDSQATMPIAQTTALITSDLDNISERIQQYLPLYENLSAWQASLNE